MLRLRRLKVEPNEFYVYPGGSYFCCGGCGGSLSPYQPERRPYKPRVCCFNRSCLKYLHVLLIGDEYRITAFDTGERATDPFLAQAGTTQVTAGGILAATPVAPREETNFTNITIPTENA